MNLEKCYQCSATLKFLWTSGISLVIEIFAPWWLSCKLEYLDFKAEGFVGNTKMRIFLEQKISVSNTFFSRKVEAALRRKFSVCKKGFYWVYSLNLQVFRFCKDIGRSKLFTYVMICHIFAKSLEQQSGYNSGHISLIRLLFPSYNTACKTFIIICMLGQHFNT